MNKTTGRRTITTVNFTGDTFESGDWTQAEVATWGEALVDDFADAHRLNAADAEYTAEYGAAQTFEYEVPGARIVALLTGGRLMTVWIIANVDAARIERAARREQPVTITYTKADGTETVRTIEPTALKLTKAGDVIVKAMDRESGEARTFRLDRVSAYTVHRTRRTVRTEPKAPSKAELVQAWNARRATAQTVADTRPQVRIVSRGWTGRTVPGTRAFGPSGWSVIVELDKAYRHLLPSGSTRVSDADLVTLTEERQARVATV